MKQRNARSRLCAPSNHGVTLIELLISFAGGLVLLVCAWAVFFASAKSENSISLLAASRGAYILRKALCKDFEQLNLSLGSAACVPTPGGLDIQIAKLATGTPSPGNPPLREGTIRYRFEKDANGLMRVRRNGRLLKTVLLSKLQMRLRQWKHLHWIEFQMQTIDSSNDSSQANPALHSTGLLIPLPLAITDPAFFDYTQWPPPNGA